MFTTKIKKDIVADCCLIFFFIVFKEAVNIYNNWFDFFHKEKPIKPLPKFDLDQAMFNQQQSGLDQSNVFAERIAYDYQLKQYEDLLVRWNSKARIICDSELNQNF